MIFFDLETTSANKDARIVQYCFIKQIGKKREILHGLINPLIAISPGATEVHGITNEMVKDSPEFREVANAIIDFIKGYPISGYNIKNFDIPVLAAEFERAGMDLMAAIGDQAIVDVMHIYFKFNPRTLSDAYRFYTGKELEGAHDAAIDVIATIDILKKMMKMHEELPKTPKEIELYLNNGYERLDIAGFFSYDDEDNIIFNKGKHKPDPAADHPDYLRWMLTKDFASDTKQICRKILKID